tara:strand:- start:2194 stop:2376 length:183 start_codon:yes stop_codon:yes gene_type:complete
MTSITPMGKDVLPYFEKLSNWGWWGLDDQHGTLNFLFQNKKSSRSWFIGDGRDPLGFPRI